MTQAFWFIASSLGAAADTPPIQFAQYRAAFLAGVDMGVDTERLSNELLDQGRLLAPGSPFHATPRSTALMRINFPPRRTHVSGTYSRAEETPCSPRASLALPALLA